MYYDRDGNPIEGPMAWAELHAQLEYVHVAFDRVDDVEVSTVWLGLDTSWGFGPPVIFETMVFGGPYDLEQRRYETEEAALCGHAEVLEMVRTAAASPGVPPVPFDV
jgi:hypothetical protein